MGKPRTKKVTDITLVNKDGSLTELGLEFSKELREVNNAWVLKIVKAGTAAEVNYIIDGLKYDALFEKMLTKKE